MARNTDLSTILFPVELRPVNYTANPETAPGGDGELSFANDGLQKSIDQYRAVVRSDTETVFAVVSKRYELLHNSRALDLGKRAFEHLFPEATPSNFVVFDIQSTRTGSACHIDLIHESYSTDVWEQETWLPFLRVSNSYNRYRALGFDFGFVRKLCSNGLIFRKETVHARFYHTKGRLEVDLTQDKTFQKLKELERAFVAHLRGLRDTPISRQLLLPLSMYLLEPQFDIEATSSKKRDREKARLNELVESLSELIKRYFKSLGGTAYTALNVATDLASHSPWVAGRFANSATLQERIASRSRRFLEALGGEHDRVEELLEDQIALVG